MLYRPNYLPSENHYSLGNRSRKKFEFYMQKCTEFELLKLDTRRCYDVFCELNSPEDQEKVVRIYIRICKSLRECRKAAIEEYELSLFYFKKSEQLERMML